MKKILLISQVENYNPLLPLYDMLFYSIVIVIFFALDQLIKVLVRIHLTSNSFVEIVPNFIHLTYQENRGISFSMFSNLPENMRAPILAGLSGVIIIGLLIYIYKNWPTISTLERWGFALIISGALGNFWDRAVRQQVTDYMYFHFYDTGFFVNNLADDLISIGFVFLVYKSFFPNKVKK